MPAENRREFAGRLARGALSLAAAAAGGRLAGFARTAGSQPLPKRPLRVCLVSGSLEYQSDQSLAAYQEKLERGGDAVCARAFRRADDDLPGLEALETTDVMLLFTRRLTIAGEQLERVKRYCLAGRPIVGVRTASHAFQNWLALDREVLGGNYRGHYGNDLTTRVEVADGAGDDPLVRSIQPFDSAGSLYRNTGLADDCRVLLVGSIPEHREPIAWHRLSRGGRVFYTSLGHPKDFENVQFTALLTRSLFWAAGRESDAAD